MKKSRIIALFLALAAAAGAFVLASGQKAPAPVQVAALAPPPPQTDDVLVAAKDLPLGTVVNEGQLQWQPWPKDAIPQGLVKKSENPSIVTDIRGSIARASMIQGEPIRREKLIKGENSGFMAAILPSGKRAVAITIDSQGATTAGGFILPNDRVDVVRTFHDSGKTTADSFVSETLLQNIRVLAIGQNVQDKNGQPVVVGSNATLELDPAEAETVILAQRTGQLSLTLRSMQDVRQNAKGPQAKSGITVVRYGAASEEAGR